MNAAVKGWIKKFGIVKRIQVRKKLRRSVYQYRLPRKEIARSERSDRDKQAVMERWSTKHPAKAAELNRLIDGIFIQLGWEDNAARLDMLFCYGAYGFTPNEYLVYQLKDKSVPERKAFISDRESVVIGYELNDLYGMQILHDKVQTYQKFSAYYQRDALGIEGEKDRAAFLEFAERNPVFVKKDARESCGRSVERIDLAQRNLSASAFFDRLPAGRKIIVEELIQQASVMEQFNPSSVNTVRCATFNRDGNISVLFCFFRTGRNGAFVDNGGSGGLFIGVDEKSGMINTDAVDEINRRYREHPDTHLPFRGFQLPDWEQMLRICREMAAQLPEVKLIGWDMAYTDKGWVAVEGNGLTEMIGPQCTSETSFRCKLEAVRNSG